MANTSWPLFDLEVRTPDLTLRYLDDDLIFELVSLAASGVHDPEFMPFSVPWTRFDSPKLEQEALRFHWRCRADCTPATFRVPLAVIRDGQLVGASDVFAEDFTTLRTFETGSWLGREFQGQGIGKLMRRMTLALGFDGFGADRATTGAWHDNGPSLGVTRSLGYQPQGRRRANREGVADELLGFDMTREYFETVRPADVEFVGLDAAREFLGIK